MKRSVLSFLSSLCIAGLLAVQAEAATIALYQTTNVVISFDPGLADTSVAAASSDPNVTAGDLALNTPNVRPLGNAWAGALSVGNANGAGNDNLETAINGDGVIFDGGGTDGGDYVSVTVTPDPGYTIDFDNVHLKIASNVNGALGLQNIDLLSSLTGFTSADSLGTFNPADPAGFANASYDFPITDAALQGVSGPVEFRFYFSNIGNRISIGQVFNGGGLTDDVVISGTVTAIPEPATLGLLVLGTAGVLLRRRS